MEYFHSSGGNNRPSFAYSFKVEKITTEMYEWCQAYPSKGPFSRFHCIWHTGNFERDNIIQFESRDSYLAFSWAFAGEILEDTSIREYRLD